MHKKSVFLPCDFYKYKIKKGGRTERTICNNVGKDETAEWNKTNMVYDCD